MAMIYTCKDCRADFNLSPNHLYPPDFYFEAGNKGTLSFSWIDDSKFRFEKEDKIRPFFETLNYWGIQRKRTKIKCDSCRSLVGYVYDDGPPMTNSPGQFHLGPSQVIPRAPRGTWVSILLGRISSVTGLGMELQDLDWGFALVSFVISQIQKFETVASECETDRMGKLRMVITEPQFCFHDHKMQQD
ncbi:hypothetical protein RJ641_010840 [Dillenia turbinata]|uniref:Uncharacterized protein n=1 Tax=Dillenia turbinata TaxID=194707 RepID=A0AAN8V2P5_9MAGN